MDMRAGELTLEEVESLPEKERAELEQLYDDLYGGQSFYDFIVENFPDEPPMRHLMPIIEAVQRARYERIRVCISMPPRHGKTVTLLRAIAWWLKHSPGDTCAYTTFQTDKAWGKSSKARQWAEKCGVDLNAKKASASHWETMSEGGMYSAGLRAGFTGQGVTGLFIVDDPYANRSDAESPKKSETIRENFREVVYTRLEGASVIVVHTRWSEDDLIGELELTGDWEVISMPAIAEDNDTLGRVPGEALWPEVRTLEELEDAKRVLGEWSFSALYQQRPRPRGARLFQEPARFAMPKTSWEWQQFMQGKYLCIGADPAATESTKADYSAAVVMAKDKLGPLGSAWILSVERMQVTVPTFVQALVEMQKKWKCLIAVEAVAGFKAIPQMLKSINPNLRIVEAAALGSKFVRAQPVASAWNDGRVFVPYGENLPWVDPFMFEVCRFSGTGSDLTDDMTDALAHAWNSMAVQGAGVSRGAYRGADPRNPGFSTDKNGNIDRAKAAQRARKEAERAMKKLNR